VLVPYGGGDEGGPISAGAVHRGGSMTLPEPTGHRTFVHADGQLAEFMCQVHLIGSCGVFVAGWCATNGVAWLPNNCHFMNRLGEVVA